MKEQPSKDSYSPAKIANSITNNPKEINNILWFISSCQSYPAHFMQLLFMEMEDETTQNDGFIKKIEYCNSSLVPTYLSIVAFHSIFPKYSNAPATLITTNSIMESEKSISLYSESCTNINHSSSLTYGEILPTSIIEIMYWIKSSENISFYQQHNNFGGKVIDLGSGNGKVLFASCTNHIFSDAYGIEISHDWHMGALHHLSTWKRNHAFYDQPNINSLTTFTKFHFVNDDILSQNTNNLLADMDVIIIHGTLFDDGLFHAIEKNIKGYCKIGTIVISITKPLRFLDTLSVQCKRMNWGATNVFIQQKML